MHRFQYARPQSLAEASSFLGDDGKFLAGGQTLIPTLKQRLAAPEIIVDLAGIAELHGIRMEGEHLAIGAMTTHAQTATDALVAKHLPVLTALAAEIGDPQVRHAGTIGGSLANNDPAADYPAAVLALQAQIHTQKRVISAADFFCDVFETALDEDEIITKVVFPTDRQAAYRKHPQPASRYALVGVCVARHHGHHHVTATGAGLNGVFRLPAFEHALDADAPIPNASPENLLTDIHADAPYRAHLLEVMARRAFAGL
ncbi:MAG: FAD binding domain-containing protein [Actinomycetia bacterium]|nr:FAD binding domain-containing protein [Actinomycetes bacterium]